MNPSANSQKDHGRVSERPENGGRASGCVGGWVEKERKEERKKKATDRPAARPPALLLNIRVHITLARRSFGSMRPRERGGVW